MKGKKWKIFLILFLIQSLANSALKGAIYLETTLEKLNSPQKLWKLDAIFTITDKDFSQESIWLDNIPLGNNYDIVKQSYQEKVVITSRGKKVIKTFSFYIKPLKYGKITIKSIRFRTQNKNKLFLTTPKTLENHKPTNSEKIILITGISLLTLVLSFKVWKNLKSRKVTPSPTEKGKNQQNEENLLTNLEKKIEEAKEYLEKNQYKEVEKCLLEIMEISQNEKNKNRLNLFLKNNFSKVKYGGIPLSESEKEELLKIILDIKNEQQPVKELYQCPVCGELVSQDETYCPKCGTEFEI